MAQDPLTLYKLIVLYMLDKVNFRLTHSQISSFILEKEYTNFMTLQQVFSDLQDAGLIHADTLGARTYFSITQEGKNTLSYFCSRVGSAIRHDIDAFLLEKHMDLKNESSITANYYMIPSGEYVAELAAMEKDTQLVNIRLALPMEDMAASICDNWYGRSQKIYKYLMEELF